MMLWLPAALLLGIVLWGDSYVVVSEAQGESESPPSSAQWRGSKIVDGKWIELELGRSGTITELDIGDTAGSMILALRDGTKMPFGVKVPGSEGTGYAANVSLSYPVQTSPFSTWAS